MSLVLEGGDLIGRNHKLLVVAMLVILNFSMNVDHALNHEKLSLGYMETVHSELSPEKMAETEPEDEKKKKSPVRKSKPGTRQILKDMKRISGRKNTFNDLYC